MSSLADAPLAVKTALALKAERAREEAAIHAATCRARTQVLLCSLCTELDDRAARLARAAGEAR